MRRAVTVLSVGAVAVILAQAVAAPVALGAFTRQAAAGHTVSSATLAPPTAFSVTTSCGGGLLKAKAVLTWTATASPFATGYTLERYQDATLEATYPFSSPAITTHTQTGLALGTTFTWKIRAVMGSTWTSVVAQVSGTTPGLCVL